MTPIKKIGAYVFGFLIVLFLFVFLPGVGPKGLFGTGERWTNTPGHVWKKIKRLFDNNIQKCQNVAQKHPQMPNPTKTTKPQNPQNTTTPQNKITKPQNRNWWDRRPCFFLFSFCFRLQWRRGDGLPLGSLSSINTV